MHVNNTYPAEFIYQKLMMKDNVIEATFHNCVCNQFYLGSSCIFPRCASAANVLQAFTDMMCGIAQPIRKTLTCN